MPAYAPGRLIKEVRTRGERGFTLVYTRLPREDWAGASRQSAGNASVTWAVDAAGKETCLVGRRPCAQTELPLLPEPGLWPLKFLMFCPTPLLPDTDDASPVALCTGC